MPSQPQRNASLSPSIIIMDCFVDHLLLALLANLREHVFSEVIGCLLFPSNLISANLRCELTSRIHPLPYTGDRAIQVISDLINPKAHNIPSKFHESLISKLVTSA